MLYEVITLNQIAFAGGAVARIGVNGQTIDVAAGQLAVKAQRLPVGYVIEISGIGFGYFQSLGSNGNTFGNQWRDIVIAGRRNGGRVLRIGPTHLFDMGRVQLSQADTTDAHNVREVAIFRRWSCSYNFV